MDLPDALKYMDVEAAAAAIEADEGEPIPGLRVALTEAQTGQFARITTPEQMLLHLKKQENIRDFRGKLPWEGDLDALRTDD
jgi:hypothetical protein